MTAWWSAASTPRRRRKGGIIIPDTAKEKPQEGEVIAVGPGARDESGKLIPLDVKAGDRVLFGKWSGTEVKLDGEDLLIMKESDIMGVRRRRAAAQARPPERASVIPQSMRGNSQWLPKKSNFPPTHATRCCAASISSPMPSRSRSGPRAATS